jgi:DNA uptake protein ComE-like DNA-binding protein
MHTVNRGVPRSLFFHMRRALVLAAIGAVLLLVGGVVWTLAAQVGSGDGVPTGQGSTSATASAKVDLNRASAEEISRRVGVSAELAERIVRHRPYKKLDDLVTRRVLGRKEFALIREQVVVGQVDQ